MEKKKHYPCSIINIVERIRQSLDKGHAADTSKTEIIPLKSRLKSFDSELMVCIDGRRLVPSSSIKYLGVKIDQHLT